ncbi:glycosyltransferase family 2 protein [Paenibacillus sp. 32O-W]|uniref:tetratricopeptide repeat-containing glycosyltransferase family 2 protein n=1 Tax=Paenibacillus sp. 32O-W TaxID=1695218 RepID=UPI00119E3E3D|nr:glycosyltransferase family 2 protein [Paenibacillus sp. 32O-W]
MGIAACVLVKDESQLLKECLDSLIGEVDEIIVVDNGSTDDSLQVARHFGVTIIECPNMLFDEARNAYLEAATADWILVLDVDERITRQSIKIIRDTIVNTPNNVMAFNLPCYNYCGQGQWATIRICRLFRNSPLIRYNNTSMHASVVPSIKKIGGAFMDISTPIHHLDTLIYGRAKRKRERNTQKLISEIQKGKCQANLFYFLGLEYSALGLFDEAEKYYFKAIDLNVESSSFARLLLAQHYLLKNQITDAHREALKVLIEQPYLNDSASLVLAEVAVRTGDLTQAKQICTTLKEKYPDEPHVYINLASLISEEDRLTANMYIEKAIDLNPYLTLPIIYKAGEQPNIFKQQVSFLTTSKSIFDTLIPQQRTNT